jgi:hypothetical protein
MATVLKTVEVSKTSVGSNPTLSANPTSDIFPHGTLAGHFKTKIHHAGQYAALHQTTRIDQEIRVILASR